MSRRGRSITEAARAAGVVPCLILGLALAPAANASYTSTGQAATSYSAATLPMPSAASFPVTASCLKITGEYHVAVTVTGTGTVQFANYLELTVRNPGGALQFTGDLSSPAQRAYTTVTSNNAGRGTWTYEIRAKYKVPNSSNVWTSQPLTRTLVCS
jgi:hypothetical protein